MSLDFGGKAGLKNLPPLFRPLCSPMSYFIFALSDQCVMCLKRICDVSVYLIRFTITPTRGDILRLLFITTNLILDYLKKKILSEFLNKKLGSVKLPNLIFTIQYGVILLYVSSHTSNCVLQYLSQDVVCSLLLKSLIALHNALFVRSIYTSSERIFVGTFYFLVHQTSTRVHRITNLCLFSFHP